MMEISTFVFAAILIYLAVTRLVPQLITWLLIRRYDIEVSIGRIGLHPLAVYNLRVIKTHMQLHVQRIEVTSSLINSDVHRPLVICFYETDIKKFVNLGSSDSKPNELKSMTPRHVTLGQFLGIYLYDCTISLGDNLSVSRTDVSLKRLTLEGISTVNNELALTLCIKSLHFNYYINKVDVPNTKSDLVQYTSDFEASATFVQKEVLSINKVQVKIISPEIITSDALFSTVKSRERAIEKPRNSLVSDYHHLLPSSTSLTVSKLKLCTHITRGNVAHILMSTIESIQLNTGVDCFDVCEKSFENLYENNELGTLNRISGASLQVKLDKLEISECETTLISLISFQLKVKVSDLADHVTGKISVDVDLTSPKLTYDQTKMTKWVNMCELEDDLTSINNCCDADTGEKLIIFKTEGSSAKSFIRNLVNNGKVNVCVNISGVRASILLSHEKPFHIVAKHSKYTAGIYFKADQVDNTLKVAEFNSELIAETVIGCFCNPKDVSATRCHVWGTIFVVSSVLIKSRKRVYDSYNDLKLETSLNNVQLELNESVVGLIEHMNRLFQLFVSRKRMSNVEEGSVNKISKHIILQLAGLNLFLVHHDYCLMTRVESVTLESRLDQQIIQLNRTCVSVVKPINSNNKSSYELQSSDHYVLNMHKFSMKRANETHAHIKDRFHVEWSPTTHMILLMFYKALVSWQEIIMNFKKRNIPIQSESLKSKQTVVKLKADISVRAKLAKSHEIAFVMSDLVYENRQQFVRFSSTNPEIRFDNHPVFRIDAFDVKLCPDYEKMSRDRDAVSGFEQKVNKTWDIRMSSLNIVFPHNYNFAEAFNNEFKSVFKWIKKLHRNNKQQEVSTAISPDLLIKVDEFLLELSDDPFEVKLRDNYELLQDEFNESRKRRDTLDCKVEEQLRMHGISLKPRKIEALYSQLNKRNAEVYVQRSMIMYNDTPQRTRLFAWTLKRVKIVALADPTLHGRDNCLRIMKEIDSDSPWPNEEPEWNTLWCRECSFTCASWQFSLRDYPQQLLDMNRLHLVGRLVGAEIKPSQRAMRYVTIKLDRPWNDVIVERSMTPMKFYYDFNCAMDQFTAAYGPCWEPAMAMFNICMEKVNAPSKDPSPNLPWWDKIRLLLHGRLTISVPRLTLLAHASLDPYNTTEEMELSMDNMIFDWMNGKLTYSGDMSLHVRTASKYDDCRLLYVPNIRLVIKLDWVCIANPNDHHTVIPCAPDRLPEYSSNQEHDSYRAFRSQNVNISIALETRSRRDEAAVRESLTPVIWLYGSTLRWFEKLQFIISGVSRPVHRGRLFGNRRPKKKQLSRHYKTVRLSLNIHTFQVCYWMSFSKQHGMDMMGNRVSLSSEHFQSIVPVPGPLKCRPRSVWSTVYMNCEFNDTEMWLQSALQEEGDSMRTPVEKCYFLSVSRVSYGREMYMPDSTQSNETPAHRLVVHSMKAAWTKSNRDVAFALFDSFVANQQLKKNLSTDALRVIPISQQTPVKQQVSVDSNTPQGVGSTIGSPQPTLNNPLNTATPSPMSRLQQSHGAAMLQQLVSEVDSNAVAFSEDCSSEPQSHELRAVHACSQGDIVRVNWLIELVNSQVLLKGTETMGYVIVCSTKSQVIQRAHQPVWRDRTLVSKTSWVGGLEGMQYYATVAAGQSDPSAENIMWLSLDNIEERQGSEIYEIPDLVGSGQSVGGVVSEIVGAPSNVDNSTIQLQRIVSRCRCEFYYVSYGEVSVDLESVKEVRPLPSKQSDIFSAHEDPIDSFTLTHNDLNVCTNSLQYAMILDIVNNLLLYVAPRKKENWERLQRMRFKVQLYSSEDQRKPIQQRQNSIRSLMERLRRLERESHMLQRQLDEGPQQQIQEQQDALEEEIFKCKEQLFSEGEELAMMIHCYKEQQLSINSRRLATLNDKMKPVHSKVVRTSEVCFRHAQWRLTEADGQLGISDLVISNFQYTKHTKNDDCVEHQMELGYLSMNNLLPNQTYSEVLHPSEVQSNMPVDRQRVLRIFLRERPPVGGISIKEHLEINMIPINIGMTYQFFKTMLRFCFPERDTEHLEEDDVQEKERDKKKDSKRKKDKEEKKESSFYVQIDKDDVEKMKERAQNNMLFIYIKVPEVTVRVSYQGEKEKNLEDVNNFSLTVPTLEYHNVTWTWLDLLLAMKNDSKRFLLSQAIKHKLAIGSRGTQEELAQAEEDKARLLLGSKLSSNSDKDKKDKSIFFHLHRSN